MKFKTLEMTNFMCFGPTQKVDFHNQGLVSVVGVNKDSGNSSANGAGKSTVVEAFVWCVWGETLRGLSSDEVVNKRTGKDCTVSLTFEDDAHTYSIIRTRKQSKAKKPNDIKLLIDKKDVSNGLNTGVQEQIDTVIGMTLKTFVQSVLLSVGTTTFSSLTDAKQKEILEDILEIDIYVKALAKVKERIKASQLKLAEINTVFEITKEQHATATAQVNNLTFLNSKFTDNQYKRRLELFGNKLSLEISLEEQHKSESLDNLVDIMKELEALVLKHTTDFNHVQQQILMLTREVNKERVFLKQKEAVLLNSKQQLQGQIASLNKWAGAQCPTCTQVVDMDNADKFLNHADQEFVKIDNLLYSVNALLAKVDQKENNELVKLTNSKGEIAHTIQELQQQQRGVYEKMQKRSNLLLQVPVLEQRISALDQELKRLDTQENPYGALLSEAGVSLAKLSKQLEIYKFSKKALDIEVSHLLFWEKGFSNQGVKSFVIEGVCPFLTERAQFYADLLSGGDLQISFSAIRNLKSGASKEEFQVTVVNSQGADVYKGNSSGEKRRSDIAIGWALGDLAANRAKKPIKLRILDEPTESLDETGIEALIKLLHTELPKYETILCITHSSHLQSFFNKNVTVTKENGFSKIS